VTIPETDGESFALIYSIEDPAGGTPNAGLGVQVSIGNNSSIGRDQ